jgi:hypothetical protein
MLRDPINLGLDGFETGTEEERVDLRRLDPGSHPGGLTLEKRVRLEPGYDQIRAEGPGAGSFELLIDGQAAGRGGPGHFFLSPGPGDTALLTISFEGPPAPLTGLWLLP